MEQGLKTQEEQILVALDTLTKQGQRQAVLDQLAKILKDKPSNAFRPQLARIANRNHAYVQALRILHPIIRNEREDIAKASPDALNVYATSLMWIGSLEEAEKILQRIKGGVDSLLTQAFIYFAQWEYQKALPVLIKYINSEKISNYQKLVGQINLLAAFIATGNLMQAKNLSLSLLPILRENENYKILYGNGLELRAQIEILENSFEEALVTLNESEKVFADQPGRYLLYVNKWRALCHLGLNPKDSSALLALATVKKEALRLRNWETLRDCDFHEARLTNNIELLQRILLGTPYKGYHDRIQSVFAIGLGESRELIFCPANPKTTPQQISLNLDRICDNSFLTSTSWPLLQLMTKDIYRPPRMGVVFSKLYPAEFFDPFTSPQRVRNSIFRFNAWSDTTDCDFKIKIVEGDFQFDSPSEAVISCTRQLKALDSWQAALKFFKIDNNSKSFTAAELAKKLGITQRSAQNILQKALQAKKVEKMGVGKSTRYIFFSGRRAA